MRKNPLGCHSPTNCLTISSLPILQVDNPWYVITLLLMGFVLLIFGGYKSLFMGPLIPMFWTSGDVCRGFQSQGRSPLLIMLNLKQLVIFTLNNLVPYLNIHFEHNCVFPSEFKKISTEDVDISECD